MDLTKELLEQLVVQEHRSFSDVGKITGKNVGQISNFAKRHKIISSHLSSITEKPLPIEEIFKRYEDGESIHALAKEHSSPPARIKRQLKKKFPEIIFRTMDEAKRPPDLNDPVKLAEYAQKDMTCRQIAEQLDVKELTVLAAYRRLNVSRHVNDVESFYVSKEELHNLYWDKKLSSVEIGEMFGVVASVIIGKLHKFGIAVRGFGGCRESKFEKLGERDWLWEEYVDKKRSMGSIAKEIGTMLGNVSHFLHKYQIPIRSKEEVCAALTGHGQVGTFESKKLGAKFEYDSLLELAFLERAETDSTITSLSRPSSLSWGNVLYYPDFLINESDLVEVKSKSESQIPGPNRRRLMKQYWVAKRNQKIIKIWNGSYYDLKETDEDVYLCQNWKLVFDDVQTCGDWLIKYGFHHPTYSRSKLLKGLDRFGEILSSGEDLLNANISGVNVVDVLRHFNEHYFSSTHEGYNSISTAWEVGNQKILRWVLDRLWQQDDDVNVYRLVALIGKMAKDFSPVSIFKPWVASFIYERLLPNGGTVVDPCMGWGGRLLGCLDRDVRYYGLDLNSHAVRANEGLRKFLGIRVGETTFSTADSSTCDLPDGDLLFTSPPYDSTEWYFGIDSAKTKTKPILDNIFKKFRGKIIALNVPKRQQDETLGMAATHSWRLSEELQMKTSSFMGREKTYEPILIFRK